ncbi:hypothetical protein BH09BAC3_BH09BAC3_36690 [soil metagenome]
MTRSIIIIATLSIFAIACTRDIAPKMVTDLTTDVIVKDKSGNNLLSTNNADSYTFGDIHLYNVNADGSRGELFNSTFLRYFEMMTDQSGQSILRIHPAMSNNQKTIITAIRWRINDEDVIEFAVSSDPLKSGHTKCNGKPTTQSTNPAARRVVEIIK